MPPMKWNDSYEMDKIRPLVPRPQIVDPMGYNLDDHHLRLENSFTVNYLPDILDYTLY